MDAVILTDCLMSRICKILFALCALLICGASAIAQDYVIRVDTELITFEAAVSDEKGEPVRGLTADDFRIFVDGTERPIDFFQPVVDKNKNRPLAVIFALDVSGSMTQEEIKKLSYSVQDFAGKLPDRNSYFAVMAFAMDVKKLQAFTNDPNKLRKSLEKLNRRQDGLSTHAYDAVDDAIRMMVRHSPKEIRGRLPKRAIVVITDGFPVGDIVSPATVIERANEAETSVYGVILPSYSRSQQDRRPLLTPFDASRLVEKTGGKSFYATGENMDQLFKDLAEEITASYAIAFYPKDTDGSGPHKVRIESKSGLKVTQNRTSYTNGDQ